MLVVVHYRNVKSLLQTFLNVEAFRSLDVLKVDAAECRGNLLYSLAELLGIFLVNLNVEHIDASVYLKQKSLAFHHWLAAHGTNVAETKHGSTVRNYSNKVAFVSILVHIVRIALYFQAWESYSWRICKTKVGLGVVRFCRLDFNFARTTALVVFQSAFFCNFYHFYSVLVILCAFIYKILTLSYNTIQK